MRWMPWRAMSDRPHLRDDPECDGRVVGAARQGPALLHCSAQAEPMLSLNPTSISQKKNTYGEVISGGVCAPPTLPSATRSAALSTSPAQSTRPIAGPHRWTLAISTSYPLHDRMAHPWIVIMGALNMGVLSCKATDAGCAGSAGTHRLQAKLKKGEVVYGTGPCLSSTTLMTEVRVSPTVRPHHRPDSPTPPTKVSSAPQGMPKTQNPSRLR